MKTKKAKTEEPKADTTYNGWTNYETWNLALWLDNDEGTQDFWIETARECYEAAKKETHDILTPEERARFALADTMKEHVEENTPVVTGFYADMLNAAIQSINFQEVATYYFEKAMEE